MVSWYGGMTPSTILMRLSRMQAPLQEPVSMPVFAQKLVFYGLY